MLDRRLLTDIGLAMLIVLPTMLPMAPAPWTTNDQAETVPAPVAGQDQPEATKAVRTQLR